MRTRQKRRSVLERAAIGAVSGAAATFALQAMMKTSAKLAPEAQPPIKQDPGEFMVAKAESLLPDRQREKIPVKLHDAAAKSLHLGYGMTSGILYGTVRPQSRSMITDGAVLGMAVWASGYLGWLPATNLMPPVSEHTAEQIALPIAQHAIFGIMVTSLYDALARL